MLILFVILSILGYLLGRRMYKYWEIRGVPYCRPIFPFGNIATLLYKRHYTELIQNIYTQFKGQFPVCGMFCIFKPVGIVTDLDLLRNILTTDFQSFRNRALYYNEKDDPLSAHLVAIEDNKWRRLRVKLTPTFTSSKMKMMFPLVLQVVDKLEKCLLDRITANSVVLISDVSARFTTDVIGTCAFGFDCNTLGNEDDAFMKLAEELLDNPILALRIATLTAYEKFFRFLKTRFFPKDISDFFIKLVRDTITYRHENNIQRGDLMDLLIELKRDDDAAEPNWDDDAAADDGKISFNEICAASIAFFVGGSETAASILAFCIHEFAYSDEIQDKCRQSVRDVLHKSDGVVTYESIMEMHYLEQCINGESPPLTYFLLLNPSLSAETLRKYPPFGLTTRKVTEDYQIPGTECVLAKDTILFLPYHAIHYDPEYYPNPKVFDPDRFSPEESAKRHQYAFAPFGIGPRNCIGLRFAMMELKIALASLLMKFSFQPSPLEQYEVVFSKRTITLTAAKGVRVKIVEL